MQKTKYIIIALLFFHSVRAFAKDYPASLFGINSDGLTLNTKSIQFAIDYINQNGGGRLVFNVGRYLSGSIHIKSNVTLHLMEGAVLMGSLNPFDYDKKIYTAFIFAYDQHDIGISGKGVIDGRGRSVARNLVELVHNGILTDLPHSDRPREDNRPMLINFRSCSNILIRRVTLKDAASWVQTYDQCKNLQIDSISVDSKAYWNNDGIDIVDCDSVAITNSYVDAADDAICLKSHDATSACKNVFVRNCTLRSSANAIKFGTVSYGGFSNIRISNIKVFDTYRSAIALESVDGGFLENVTIDSLMAYNTGNAIFLRLGERAAGRKGRFEKVTISNVYVEIPPTKPDAGYEFEGPIEDMPRNISPIVVAGLPGQLVTDISFNNITIKHPGGGNPYFANASLDRLDSIPELPAKYPDFSMFLELPAWGIYVRHAKGLKFSNITLECSKKDYRPPVVLDDVHASQLGPLFIKQPGPKKNITMHNSTGVTIKN